MPGTTSKAGTQNPRLLSSSRPQFRGWRQSLISLCKVLSELKVKAGMCWWVSDVATREGFGALMSWKRRMGRIQEGRWESRKGRQSRGSMCEQGHEGGIFWAALGMGGGEVCLESRVLGSLKGSGRPWLTLKLCIPCTEPFVSITVLNPCSSPRRGARWLYSHIKPPTSQLEC